MKTVSILTQLELERGMIARGIENYEATVSKAEDAGRAASTAYAQRIIREYFTAVTQELEGFLGGKHKGRRSRVHVLLNECAPEKAMLLALQALFNSFTFEAQIISTAVRIGRMIEDEIRFTWFEETHGSYMRAIKNDFKRKSTQSYRHKHRVLTHVANKQDDEWEKWPTADCAAIGTKLIDIILTKTDMIEKRTVYKNQKTIVYLQPTPQVQQKIRAHNAFSKFLFPDKMPCVVPPDPWTALDQGGYYSPELRAVTPMVKTSSKQHRQVIRNADLSKTMEALNTVQNVAWQVNPEVHRIVTDAWSRGLPIGMPQKEPLEIPESPIGIRDVETLTEIEKSEFAEWKHLAAGLYEQERKRISQALLTSRIIQTADDYIGYDKFWYVWYMDFRGRMYVSTVGLSPQGPDIGKGLIRFAEGKPLGEHGWYWLRVHGANRYGYDKVSYDNRVKWVEEHHAAFIAAANDPLAHLDIWASADKPWQFLAFLFEYRDCCALQSIGRSASEFVSYLPVGLDGSCNGLQNFSAALRDHVGGAATNLVPSELPADIYIEVARVCTSKLHGLLGQSGEDQEWAVKWLDYCDKYGKGSIPRALAKRPVMTLPYGAMRQSCTQYIFDSILDTDRKHFDNNFKAACWLTTYLWEAMGDVVIAARDAMSWLQKCSSAVTKDSDPLIWDTPDGFRVYQANRIIETTKIDTQLGGRFQVRIGTTTDKLDSHKQRNSVAPNFVHSMDATHLRETVRRAWSEGITSLAVIHDDYGTHAADTHILHRLIREAFVSLYTLHDPLDDFRVAHEAEGRTLPPMPPRGALQIQDVLRSDYFFS